MLRNLIERFGLLVLVACAAAMLHYYGGLTFQASLLIGGAFVMIAMWLYLLKQLAAFEPYRITVGINYEAVREDFKLAVTSEPQFENFTFDALTAAVFARSDEREYSSQVDLWKEVPCSEPTWIPSFGGVYKNPVFFLQSHGDGYKFGLNVDSDWWNAHKPLLPPALSGIPLSYDHSLILGVLPHGYLPEHIRRWHKPVSLWYSFDRKQRRWEARLKQHGWTIKDDYPEYVSHRYLVFVYRKI